MAGKSGTHACGSTSGRTRADMFGRACSGVSEEENNNIGSNFTRTPLDRRSIASRSRHAGRRRSPDGIHIGTSGRRPMREREPRPRAPGCRRGRPRRPPAIPSRDLDRLAIDSFDSRRPGFSTGVRLPPTNVRPSSSACTGRAAHDEHKDRSGGLIRDARRNARSGVAASARESQEPQQEREVRSDRRNRLRMGTSGKHGAGPNGRRHGGPGDGDALRAGLRWATAAGLHSRVRAPRRRARPRRK